MAQRWTMYVFAYLSSENIMYRKTKCVVAFNSRTTLAVTHDDAKKKPQIYKVYNFTKRATYYRSKSSILHLQSKSQQMDNCSIFIYSWQWSYKCINNFNFEQQRWPTESKFIIFWMEVSTKLYHNIYWK